MKAFGLLAVLIGAVSLGAHAQTPPAADALPVGAPVRDQPPASRVNAAPQVITVEDGGSRIDEVRAVGETQRIRVQPKVGDMPAYEVTPQTAPANAGQRMWNLMKF